MIRNFTRKPTVEFHFIPESVNDPGAVWYWLTVDARGKNLESQAIKADPAELSPEAKAKFASLSAVYLPVREAHSALKAKRPASYSKTCQTLAEMAENAQYKAEWRTVSAQYTAARGEFVAFAATLATPDFKKRATSRAIVLEVAEDDTDERSYALYRGAVWVCDRPLETAQWQVLVDRIIQREEAELACVLAEGPGASQTRGRIPPELRRAVWIRDGGKCARCSTRERLEYDHIVPLARGGSNTERNIELLCEGCNRTKSDSIT
jgi:hypothetical protein